MDGYGICGRLSFRIAILRDKLEYLGEAFCRGKEINLASLANFPPLNFCCYPPCRISISYRHARGGKRRKKAITEMKKLASGPGDKVLLRYLALYEKWQGKLLAKQIAKLLHTSRHARSWICWKKTQPAKLEMPETTLHWRRRNPDRKSGAGNETEKILEAEGKRASLLREEPFFYARDSVEYKAHLMIWDK